VGDGVTATDDAANDATVVTIVGQTPWQQDVQAAGFSLSGATSIDAANVYVEDHIEVRSSVNNWAILANPSSGYGDLAFCTMDTWDPAILLMHSPQAINLFFNTGIKNSSPAYALDVNGDCNITGQYLVNGVPISTGGGSQTPWLQDVDAAGFSLINCLQVMGPNYAYMSMADGQFYVNATNQIVLYQGENYPIDIINGGGGVIDIHAQETRYQQVPGTGHLFYTGTRSTTAFCILPNPTDDTRTVVGIMNDAPAYALDVVGDVNVTGVFRINGVPLNTGGSQSPWESDIDAAGYSISSLWNIGMGGSITGNGGNSINNFGHIWSREFIAQTDGGAWALTCNGDDFRINYRNSGFTVLQFFKSSNPNFVQLNWPMSMGGTQAPRGTALLEMIGTGGPPTTSGTSPNNVMRISVYAGGPGIGTGNVLDFGGYKTSPYGMWLQVTDLFGQNYTYPLILQPNGGRVGITVTNPQYALDISGDCNISGIYRINGTPLSASSLGAAPATTQIIPGTGLSGGGPISTNVTLSVAADTTIQRVRVSQGSTFIAAHQEINFISGSNITCTVTDDTIGNRVNVNIAGTFAVSSVFTRTGAVVAQAGDYTAAQVTNAVSSAATYADPAWITALAWSKITGAPTFMADPTTTRGDLIVHGVATTTRLAVGADNTVLMADGAQANGVKWGSVPASVFGRTGVVVATTGDYTAAQVTNAVDSTGSYANPAWITSLAASKITGIAGSGIQTPWLSDIDAAQFKLKNVYVVALQNDGTQLGDPNPSNPHLLLGSTVAQNSQWGILNFLANNTGVNTTLGYIQFCNLASTGGSPTSDHVLASIVAYNDGALNTGKMQFTTRSTGVAFASTKMLITSSGNVGIGVGVSTAAYPLEVNGDINTTGQYRINGVVVSAVTSVFGRTGAVVATAGDYTAAQVTNAVSTAGSYADPSWITSIAYSKLSGAPTTGQISVMQTPWLQVIDGGGNSLTNCPGVSGAGLRLTCTAGTMSFYNGGTQAATLSPSIFTGPQIVLAKTTSNSTAPSLQVQNSNAKTWGLQVEPGLVGTDKFQVVLPTGSAMCTFTTGGSVGIGTNTPGYTLDIVGDCNLSAGSVYRINGVAIGGGTPASPTNSVQFNNAGAFGGSASLIWDNTNGRLGINASAPYSRLHVKAGASGAASAVNADTVIFAEHSSNAYYEIVAGATKQAGLVMGANGQPNSCGVIDQYDGTNHMLQITANPSGSYMTFFTAGAERMRITAAGNVGIGINAPDYPLTVYANQVNVPVIKITTQNSGCGLGIYSTSSQTAARNWGVVANFLAYGDFAILQATAQGQSAFSGASNVKFYIDATGSKVGIGTTAPQWQLHVSASGGVAVEVIESYGGSAYLQGRSAGGTSTSPTATPASTSLFIMNPSGWDGSAWQVGASMSFVTEELFSATARGTNIQFFTTAPGTTNYAERMRITGLGNVGIGNNGVPPFSGPGYVHATIGSTTATGGIGFLNLATNDSTTSAGVGHISFCNYNIAAADKRVAQITCSCDGATNSGQLIFYIYNAGTITQRMQITSNGNILVSGKIGIGITPVWPMHIKMSTDVDLGLTGGVSVSGAACIQAANDAWTVNIPIEIRGSFTAFPLGQVSIGGASAPPSGCGLAVYTPGNVAYNGWVGQFQIQQNNNANYRLTMGMDANLNAGYIQATTGAAATNLLLNPAGGNVGIYTTSPICHVEIYNPNGPFTTSGMTLGGGASSGACVGFTGNGAWGLYFGFQSNGTNWIQAGRTDSATPFNLCLQASGGSVGIGTLAPGYMLAVGTDSAGKPGTNTWTIASDVRLKQNVKPLQGGMPIIDEIVPMEAEYNGLANTPKGHRVVSVVAEELRKILPGCVPSHRGKLDPKDKEDTDILDFNSHEILFHLILAVQQLNGKIKTLEASNRKLRAKKQ